ncbi:MAG: hypothetical protein APR63_14320 [Desulfuromonas sp. SDB]|nr:MAG: hypothetical protein APR63_14320 [Desulfuromonas sp. SDB]
MVSKITVLLSLYLLPQTQMWSRYYGGSVKDEAFRLNISDNKNYILVGLTESFGAGKSDIYVLYLDSFGDTCWTVVIGVLSSFLCKFIIFPIP